MDLWPFLSGLVVGVFVGLALGPVIRSWLAWREWRDAARQASLTHEMVRLLEADAPPPDNPRRGRKAPHGRPRTSSGWPAHS